MPLAEAYKGYTKTMWDRLSVLATWQPDVTLSVGDVVTAGAGGVHGPRAMTGSGSSQRMAGRGSSPATV